MHPVARKSCQVLTLFGEMCLEMHSGFESQVRRHEVGGPKSCREPPRKQPAGGKTRGRGGTLCPSRTTEAELCSRLRFPPIQGDASGMAPPASKQDHHLPHVSVPSSEHPLRGRTERPAPATLTGPSALCLACLGLQSIPNCSRVGQSLYKKNFPKNDHFFQHLIMPGMFGCEADY